MSNDSVAFALSPREVMSINFIDAIGKKAGKLLRTPNSEFRIPNSSICLCVSLLFPLYYGFCFYYFVFNQEYIVQDDARQHVVWLQRFVDANLFPNDLIADYFSGLAPIGFKSLYFWGAKLGLEPLLLAKLLPPVLAVITTFYLYLFTLQIFPQPLEGLISSLLINQLLWLNDDLVSATPRAFIYPLFAAFLYYLSRDALIPCGILMLLQGLIYPHIVLVEMAILSLGLLCFRGKLLINFTNQKQPYIWWLVGLIMTAIALYPLTQKPPELATTVTAAQMRQMPEFNLGGRSPFFGVGWLKYWFTGSSGLTLPLFPTIVWTGLALPWLLTKKRAVARLITPKINILTRVVIASLLMFTLAHLLLPKLHLPSRYTYHTIQLVLAVAAGIVLTTWVDFARQWLKNKRQFSLVEKAKIALVTLCSLAVIIIPGIPYISIAWFQDWRVGTATEIYQYLALQPQDILVASLSTEVNNIPAFTQRSILVGDEFAMAYHPAYHRQIQQRTVDLLKAQYSPDLKILQSFIQQYGVDYLLLDDNAFNVDYLANKGWLINSSWSEETQKAMQRGDATLGANPLGLGGFPHALKGTPSDKRLHQEAIAQLKSPQPPVLTALLPSCLVVSTKNLNLLASSCILGQTQTDKLP